MKPDHDRPAGPTSRRDVPRLAALAAAVAALAWAAPGLAHARVDPMAAAVIERFTMIERSFLALAEAMPAEKYGFKPAEGQFEGVRTFGEQVKHVACADYGFFRQIAKQEPPASRLARAW